MDIKIKEKAFLLRRAGKSYNQIKKELNLSKGTIANWFKNIDWSKDIKKQLEQKAIKNNKERLKRWIELRKTKLTNLYEGAAKEAEKSFFDYKNNSLFIAGLMLYWGEGDKNFKFGSIKLANTDPLMINIFRQFLLKICSCDKEKIKGWLLLYPDLKPEECKKYWVRTTGIPYNNFTKPVIIKGKHKTHRLPYGVCTIQISNKYLKKKLLTWIEVYKREFQSMRA